MNPRMVFNWTENNAMDVFYSVSRTSKNANFNTSNNISLNLGQFLCYFSINARVVLF